jgi:hypothetical protein
MSWRRLKKTKKNTFKNYPQRLEEEMIYIPYQFEGLVIIYTLSFSCKSFVFSII